MLIDCQRCIMRNIACSDCVVSTLLATPESALPHLSQLNQLNQVSEVSEGTAEAIELLSSRGILRPIRFLGLAQG